LDCGWIPHHYLTDSGLCCQLPALPRLSSFCPPPSYCQGSRDQASGPRPGPCAHARVLPQQIKALPDTQTLGYGASGGIKMRKGQKCKSSSSNSCQHTSKSHPWHGLEAVPTASPLGSQVQHPVPPFCLRLYLLIKPCLLFPARGKLSIIHTVPLTHQVGPCTHRHHLNHPPLQLQQK
jgi:hypothetical protein